MHILGHGIDLVETERIAVMLDDHGERFRARCFTEAEQRYAERGQRRRAERYAARFACKEAVMKALGTGWSGGVTWTDIDVAHEPSGRPVVRLSGRSAELADQLGIRHWIISVSHAGGFAMASAIAWGEKLPGDAPNSRTAQGG